MFEMFDWMEMNPIPTPTPGSLISQSANLLQDSQALLQQANNLTALGVLALFGVAIILYIVLGRNRGKENLTVINTLTEQSRATADLMQKVLDRLETRLQSAEQESDGYRDDLKKQAEDHRLEGFEREDRIIESIKGFTEAHLKIADNGAQSNRLLALHETNYKMQGDTLVEMKAALTKLTDIGSPPVQTIGRKVDDILVTVAETRDIVKRRLEGQPAGVSQSLSPQIIELNLAISVLKDLADSLRKHDTGPIPQVTLTVTPESAP